MKPLTLDKAVELYKILGDHVPEISEDETALQFIGKIVNNIRQSKQHENYIDAVMLMSDKEWSEIKQMESESVLDLFIAGLTENKIVQLKSFFDAVGFNHA